MIKRTSIDGNLIADGIDSFAVVSPEITVGA
jgi:hypothetical protein